MVDVSEHRSISIKIYKIRFEIQGQIPTCGGGGGEGGGGMFRDSTETLQQSRLKDRLSTPPKKYTVIKQK
jgi:hypothetical protein